MKAEQYLVQVLKRGTSIKVMDELRYWMYHHGRSITVDNLPPSSHLLRGYILRAFYATHIQIYCLDGQSVDPLLYGLRSLMVYYFHLRTAESVLMILLIAVHALSVLQLVVPAEKARYCVVHFANITMWKLHYKTAKSIF